MSIPSLCMDQPGYDTHAECQDNGIVYEGDERMKQRQMPDLAGRDGHVGDLEGHADHKGKIGKVQIVR